MANITTSKVNFDCLQIMDLLYQIEKATSANKSAWCSSVKSAISNHTASGKEIISTVKDMATDNYSAVADVLGVRLTNKILLS